MKTTRPLRLEVAPMMGVTHRHFRYLCRLLSPHSVLYTEMLTTQTLLHTRQYAPEKWRRCLDYHPKEHPLVLQLGGSCPHALAACARMAQAWGYDAVNLNVGCPSRTVQSALVGAVLFHYPDRVRDCLAAMQAAVSIPVTIKTRLGVDALDSEADLMRFVEKVGESGVGTWIIHARKAWLKGLNPKQNRTVPPLQPERVLRLKAAYPALDIVLNGGISTLEAVLSYQGQVDGVMLGRAVSRNLCLLAQWDRACSAAQPDHDPVERVQAGQAKKAWLKQVLTDYITYVAEQYAQGVPIALLISPLFGVLYGEKGARKWRYEWGALANHIRKQAPSLPGSQSAVSRVREQLMDCLHSTLDCDAQTGMKNRLI